MFVNRHLSNIFLSKIGSIQENPVFDLIYAQNTGAAFNLLENYPIILIAIGILAILGIFIVIIQNIEKLSLFACLWTSVLLSGIICNLYERLYFGYVRDFFKLNFIDFPVFNISDIFINAGVIALIVIILKNKYLRK